MAVTCHKFERPFGTSHIVRDETVELGVVHSGTYNTTEYRREDPNGSDTWAYAVGTDGVATPIVPTREMAIAILLEQQRSNSNV